MAIHVYVQNNEVACAAASGKSAAAFPDPCFSPPVPPPTGAPLPYPNTCHAKNITKGSKTVLIRGSTIAIEKKAYFSTSEGDVGATQALKKGVVSGKIDGRAYFQSWAADVKVENYGVACHFDMVSHNHGSPTNTPLFPYLSGTLSGDHPCAKVLDDINHKCSDDRTSKDAKGKYDYNEKWQDKHCPQSGAKSTNSGGRQTGDSLRQPGTSKKTRTNAFKILRAIVKTEWKIKESEPHYKSLRRGTYGERLANAQSYWAIQNPCLKARRCNIVPHTKGYNDSKATANHNDGCCDDQTGHHLIPGATMKTGCAGYNHSTAPTVCAEGSGRTHGTHGMLHEAWDRAVKANHNRKLKLEKMIFMAANVHREVFNTNCKQCVAAQLKAYFDKECSGTSAFEPRMSDGKNF